MTLLEALELLQHSPDNAEALAVVLSAECQACKHGEWAPIGSKPLVCNVHYLYVQADFGCRRWEAKEQS